MERTEIMDKVVHNIKSRAIMDAMSDLDTVNFNNGLGGLIRADFGCALAFCLGLACGTHEERQRMKGGSEA